MGRSLEIALVACAGLAVMTCSTLAGPATEDVEAQLTELVSLIDYGQDVGGIRFFEMKSGDVVTLPFDANAMSEYYVNASCDEDCVNVDLAAIDADGTVAGVDDADDDGPIINFRPTENASAGDRRPMTIEVRMIACATEICAVGLRIEQVVDGIADLVDDPAFPDKTAEEYLRDRVGRGHSAGG